MGKCNEVEAAYHRFDVGVGYSFELHEVKLEIVTNVDICTLVFCHIAVLGCGEDWDH